ncbi:hypothetical protein D3C75_737950 [compost metagenome]
MARFEQLQDSLNIERIYRLGYQLALYYSERRQYTLGVDYILQCLKAAIQLNSTKDILECVTLFEGSRENAAGQQLLRYGELIKGLRKNQELAANREQRSAIAERSI